MSPIRQLTAKDLADSFALSQYAFQYKLSPDEIAERRRRANLETMWGYFEEGHLAAKMTIHPFSVFMCEKPMATGGVASVATWPEHRRKGMVKKLLIHGLKTMKENGQSIALLHPFSFSFYRKYGWEHVFDYKQYTIAQHQIPTDTPVSGTVRRKGHADTGLLNTIYETYAKQFNGTLQRTDDRWRHTVLRKDKDVVAVFYEPGDKPTGYLIYEIQDSVMRIKEFVYVNETGRRGLWQFIRNHDSMIRQVHLTTVPKDDQLPFLLNDPCIKQEIVPYFMGRIVDVAAFLSQYAFAADCGSEPFVFHIKDPHAPWNDDTFVVDISKNGTAYVSIRSGHEDASSLTMDIQTCTAIFFGYQRPTYLHDVGRLLGNREAVERLERAVPHRTPYILDYF